MGRMDGQTDGRTSKQIGTYGVSVWVSLMYFKWDLFRRHIKNGFMWLKLGFSCYFFV